MHTTITETLAAARSAEQTLASTIHSAAAQIDQVGVNPLAEALARLAVSANDCRDRMNLARADAVAILTDLGGFLAGFAREVTAEPVQLSAPVAAVHVEPTPAPAPQEPAHTPQTAEPSPEPTPEPIAPPATAQPQETVVPAPAEPAHQPEEDEVVAVVSTAALPAVEPTPAPALVISSSQQPREGEEVAPAAKVRARGRRKAGQ